MLFKVIEMQKPMLFKPAGLLNFSHFSGISVVDLEPDPQGSRTFAGSRSGTISVTQGFRI
jgi:hypothetical protein